VKPLAKGGNRLLNRASSQGSSRSRRRSCPKRRLGVNPPVTRRFQCHRNKRRSGKLSLPVDGVLRYSCLVKQPVFFDTDFRMNFSLSLTPEAEKRLSERAAQQGKSLQGFLQEIVEKEASVANGTEVTAATQSGTQPGDGPQAAPDASDAESEAPWRGVFAAPRDRETFFTAEVEFRIADLPRREPQVAISPRWLDDDE
jgi:hypothetical protein